jgi:hypothetical protein
MNRLLTVLIISVTSFVATNLDDLIVLTLFFCQVNANFRTRQVVAGQYLGFTLILLASSIRFWEFLLIYRKFWAGRPCLYRRGEVFSSNNVSQCRARIRERQSTGLKRITRGVQDRSKPLNPSHARERRLNP